MDQQNDTLHQDKDQGAECLYPDPSFVTPREGVSWWSASKRERHDASEDAVLDAESPEIDHQNQKVQDAQQALLHFRRAQTGLPMRVDGVATVDRG